MFVAMSGGVDSSVSAFLLRKKGINVKGVTFRLFDSDSSKKAIDDAKIVCDHIGIEHIVLDLRNEFKKNVIEYFINEYAHGRTPNPCAICNKTIKFGAALEKLQNLGTQKIATGHYSKIVHSNGRYCVKKNSNFKDQSYYFCLLSQSQLGKIVTPVADFSKNEVRKIAQENNIPVWNKKDSQDICFIENSYREFLKKTGIKPCRGNFINESGDILGAHEGIHNYTVGQRKGLGVSFGKRVYIKKINYLTNEIIVSYKFIVTKFEISNVNFVSFDRNEIGENVQICVRYNSIPINCKIKINNSKNIIVILESPSSNVCPGQFAVAYTNNFLAFGGVISRIIP